MIVFFYILAVLALITALGSLVAGIKYHRFISRELLVRRAEYQPKVTLIVPCKDIDQNFSSNIRAFLDQTYPNFEIIFVVASSQDPAYAPLQQLVASSRAPASLVTGGPAINRGQKVHNLIAAVNQLTSSTEVIAFSDSDACPDSGWLENLVVGLADSRVGITTGYRWYLPPRGNFWSVLQSVWNSGVATLLGDHENNFAWGGSMAIRRSTFQEIGVLDYWNGALSDDYAMTHAATRAGYLIKFVPRCLVVTYEECNLKSLLEWVFRQVVLTKVYSPKLWRLGAASQIIHCSVLFWGLGFLLLRTAGFYYSVIPFAIVASILLLAISKGSLRMISIMKIMPEHAAEIRRYWWGYAFLTPFTSLVSCYGFIKSMLTHRVTWRGITYEMASPSKTIIIRSGKQTSDL